MKVRVHSAKVPDQDGIRLLLEPVRGRLGRLSHLWVDAGYQGRGKRWAEEVMGLSVEVVRKAPKQRLRTRRSPTSDSEIGLFWNYQTVSRRVILGSSDSRS
jgi:hypothetical protein